MVGIVVTVLFVNCEGVKLFDHVLTGPLAFLALSPLPLAPLAVLGCETVIVFLTNNGFFLLSKADVPSSLNTLKP